MRTSLIVQSARSLHMPLQSRNISWGRALEHLESSGTNFLYEWTYCMQVM